MLNIVSSAFSKGKAMKMKKGDSSDVACFNPLQICFELVTGLRAHLEFSCR